MNDSKKGVDIQAIVDEFPIVFEDMPQDVIDEVNAENERKLQALDAALRQQYGITDETGDSLKATPE